VNVYTGGRFTLFHLDLYRLETRAQILSAGLDEYLSPDGITVIEWAERWFDEARSAECEVRDIGAPLRRVKIEVVSETERRIVYEDSGA
jgi:tRNA threonylcarbamoyladenosine biosynthesis protein TsaE